MRETYKRANVERKLRNTVRRLKERLADEACRRCACSHNCDACFYRRPLSHKACLRTVEAWSGRLKPRAERILAPMLDHQNLTRDHVNAPMHEWENF